MCARNLAILVVGVASSAAQASRAQEPPQESAVFEAVVKQQLEEHLDASARARGMVLCVGINPGDAPQTPRKEFMARFRLDKVVRSLGECDPRSSGAVEAVTSRPAVIVTAGPIDWKAADEAWVTVTYFRTKSQSAVRRYRVVRERTGWVSLGQIILDLPARP